jgi:hypothetical protein
LLEEEEMVMEVSIELLFAVRRGDKAFCSTDCRTQQILLDEPHDNCAVAALKTTTTSGASSRRNRVVAAAAGTAAVA